MNPVSHTQFPKIQSERYRILAVLGSGAVGTVYKAEDTLLSKTVAIKKLNKNALASDAARFHREAKLAGTLNHPNVLGVIDFGLTDEEEPYLVLSYLEGSSLASRLKRGPLDFAEALGIFIQIARGLRHAHGRNVIHRDIKPSNIMLLSACENPEESVKIVDFGLAKSMLDEQPEVTKSGVGVGTPMYMSPEQIHGAEVDHRTDMYSFGCLMYETLSGRKPFNSDNFVKLVEMHMTCEPPPLRTRVRNDVPDSLVAIVQRCMAKDPDERFADAEELLAALEKIVPDNKVSMPDPVLEKAPTAVSQMDWRVVAGAGAVVLVVSGGIGLAATLVSSRSAGSENMKSMRGHPERFTRTSKNGTAFLAEPDANDDDLKAFLKVHKGWQIQELVFDRSNITDKGLKYLRRVKLASISIKRVPVSKAMLKNLSEITSLQTISLHKNSPLDCSGFAYLASSPHLTQLVLYRQSLDTEALESIGKCTSLRQLFIKECTGLGGNNARCLRPLRRLERLDLSGSDISDEGLEAFIGNPIDRLNLCGAILTDKTINTLRKMPTVKELNLATASGISKQELVKFHLERPSLQIQYMDGKGYRRREDVLDL